ncbi:M23 family metallopeptidase [Tenacibaculum ovolyticum]|uniref:M23 family metallopeptidase n=1 Tax=Tenacibaculum ovolyticum TaxID=104270 RepID=UPI0018D35C84|nr:M23 family metallopeptidase [Tenacibaculum ovolyticum]
MKNIPIDLPLKVYKTELSSIYGGRFHPIDKKRKKHRGIDLKANIGEFIYAPANGVVSQIKLSNKGYGKRIRITHLFKFETFYAHLSMILVKKNQIIRKGDIIGLIGSTGKSTGAHLHYEIYKNKKNINPGLIIKNMKYE